MSPTDGVACPVCGQRMALREAKRGPNAGSQFWGCTRYPLCKGTLSPSAAHLEPIQSVVVQPPVEFAGSTQPGTVAPRAVAWSDATLRRKGWRARFESLGASLRSVDAAGTATTALSACWIAREHLRSYEPADDDTRRVVGMMGKLLHRGNSPPLHPAAERELLEVVGLGDQILASRLPGDQSVRLRRQPPVAPSAAFPPTAATGLAVELLDSDAERQFVAWLGAIRPEAAAWLSPQVPFDRLLRAHHVATRACRRCDFLLNIPGHRPVVIEIDGLQHDGQVLTDAARDEHLKSIDIATIRVPTSELDARKGAGLNRVKRMISSIEASSVRDPLVWVPLQLHRLVLALLEAVQAGFVGGDRWVVEVHDPTGLASRLLGPYLETLDALDQLWGAHGVAPARVVLIADEGALEFTRGSDGRYERSDITAAPPADVCIRLELDHTPFQALPRTGTVPTIVVRSCSPPVPVSDVPLGGAERVAVRTTGDSTAHALRTILRSVFAKADFREGQLEAIVEVLEGRDCTVLLPTGAGKSLVYQMAGLCLPGRTLIVDPLVALIEDQVEGLRANGIDRVVGITGDSLRSDNGRALLEQVADADAYFVFVAPERLQMQSFRTALRELAGTTPINLAVIDEAHCVSEWGHQFRTSYLNLGSVLRSACMDPHRNPPPLLALTGTASRAVLRDVLFQLGIEERSPNTIIRPRGFDRKELSYRVVPTDERDSASSLRNVLKSLPPIFHETSQTFFDPDGENTYSGLVFVPVVNGKHGILETAAAVEAVCGSPGIYSGSAPKGQPDKNWNSTKKAYATAFKRNATPVLVTTNAFGMGIDKPNIRWVIHYGLPGSIESYYQEVGRAGRGGDNAECVLLLSQFDTDRNRQLLAEDLTLDEARTRQKAIKWAASDDVTTALYFHMDGFPGIDEEVASLLEMVELIGPGRVAAQVDVPFSQETQQRRQRALHRLVMLGVVDDYLVEWGSSSFTVYTASVTTKKVITHLCDFVERSQPARLPAMRADIDRRYSKLADAVERCGRLMVQFVYDTIERSRRRSLREMWLAAIESRTGEDLRRRVLDYLVEGDVAPILERLVEVPRFRFNDWIEQWAKIAGTPDVREWRAASARLLGSFPDHPGLLASRGLVEGLDPDGELRELELNLNSAINSARKTYRTKPAEIDDALCWILDRLPASRPRAHAAVIGTAEAAKHRTPRVREWLRRQPVHSDAALATLGLAVELEEMLELADFAVHHFQET